MIKDDDYDGRNGDLCIQSNPPTEPDLSLCILVYPSFSLSLSLSIFLSFSLSYSYFIPPLLRTQRAASCGADTGSERPSLS